MKITNFGENIHFNPKYFYTPKNEDEVLSILNKHNNESIRAIGSLHSWSNIITSNDVILDLKNFNNVLITKNEKGQVFVEVGGGCVLEDLINNISSEPTHTIPTLGAIKRQTMAGAVSTATHGSGSHSISHFLEEMSIAAYDPKTKKAKIYHWKKDDQELKAARCAIGCMGIILSVKFPLISSFWLKETINRYKNFTDVIEKEKEFPLQQFMLVPYLWEYFAYHRKKIPANNVPNQNNIKRWMNKAIDFLLFEAISHFTIKTLANITERSPHLSRQLIPKFFIHIAPVVLRNKTEYHNNDEALTLHTANHYLFKHLEMEIFIPEEKLKDAVEIIRFITSIFANTPVEESGQIKSVLQRIEAWKALMEYKGSYVHHYPFFFRRILPDDTLISMTSGDTIYYSISFFTYLSPNKRKHFFLYANFIAFVLTRLFSARLHWGKYYPLVYDEIKHLYPKLKQFRDTCLFVDPQGVFTNEFTKKILGMPSGFKEQN